MIGNRMIELDEVDSTNTYLQEKLLSENLEEGLAVTAEFQTTGKGHGKNTWESGKGQNLLVSFFLKPSFLSPARQFFFNQAVSLALVDLLQQYLKNVTVQIKWPNDILAGQKKICGILIKNTLAGNKYEHAITGIGLNVNQAVFNSPFATSMHLMSRKIYDRRQVLLAFFNKMQQRYSQLQNGDMQKLQKDYMKNLFGIDERRNFMLKNEKVFGKITGLSSSGQLIVELNGKHEVFGFKEIEYLF